MIVFTDVDLELGILLVLVDVAADALIADDLERPEKGRRDLVLWVGRLHLMVQLINNVSAGGLLLAWQLFLLLALIVKSWAHTRHGSPWVVCISCTGNSWRRCRSQGHSLCVPGNSNCCSGTSGWRSSASLSKWQMSALRKTYPSVDQVLESEEACPQYQHQVDVEAVDAHLCHVFWVRDLLHLDARICGEFRQMLLLEDFFLDFFWDEQTVLLQELECPIDDLVGRVVHELESEEDRQTDVLCPKKWGAKAYIWFFNR